MNHINLWQDCKRYIPVLNCWLLKGSLVINTSFLFFLSLVHDIFKVHKQTSLIFTGATELLKNSISRHKRQTSHVLPEIINFNHKGIYVVLSYYWKKKKEPQQVLLKRNTQYHRTNFRRDKPTCFVLFHAISPCRTWIPALVVTK